MARDTLHERLISRGGYQAITPRAQLLWLTIHAPVPPTSGARLRTLGLLTELSAHYDITVCLLLGEPPSEGFGPSGVSWVTCHAPRLEALASMPALISRGKPPHLRHFASRHQRHAVGKLMRETEWAAVVADSPYAAAALAPPVSGRDSRPPVLVVTHNIEAEVWETADPDLSGGRFRLALDRRAMPHWELEALRAARGVAFCSDRDGAVLRPNLPESVHTAVVPNALDVESLSPLPAASDMSTVLFVGGLDYQPNREAAHFITTRLAPMLAAQGMTALIIGGDGSDGPGCRFVGRVTDILPFYRQAFASIVPLFSGSGTRFKVLEAFALGRPVVASPKAVQGLDVVADQHYLAAQSELEFMNQLDRLTDISLSAAITHSARRFVEEHHSWPVAGRRMEQLLAIVVGSGQ